MRTKELSDTKLSIYQEQLEAMRKGDFAFIHDFYISFFPAIRQMIIASNGTDDDAKDIFQDAILLIYYKSQNPHFSLTSKFSTYFYGICKNLWGNRMQKKDFLNVTLESSGTYNTDPVIDIEDAWAEKRLLYDRAYRKLDLPCRKLLNLFFDKIPMNQIAVIMGFRSEGYAKRRKHQCKERLIELVKREPGYDELYEEEKSRK